MDSTEGGNQGAGWRLRRNWRGVPENTCAGAGCLREVCGLLALVPVREAAPVRVRIGGIRPGRPGDPSTPRPPSICPH